MLPPGNQEKDGPGILEGAGVGAVGLPQQPEATRQVEIVSRQGQV
jgi:hypothetical protein